MSLQLRPAALADIPAMVDVYFAAFLTNAIHQRCFPRSASVRAFWEQRLQKAIANHPNILTYVMTDLTVDGDPVVAFVQWNPPQSGGGIALPQWPIEGDTEFADLFYSALKSCKAKNMGTRPFWELSGLATSPKYQGRGIAGTLIKLGLEKADEQGLETYVEASPVGRPLYAKFGFEVVDELLYLDGTFTEYTMIRKATGGVSNFGRT